MRFKPTDPGKLLAVHSKESDFSSHFWTWGLSFLRVCTALEPHLIFPATAEGDDARILWMRMTAMVEAWAKGEWIQNHGSLKREVFLNHRS